MAQTVLIDEDFSNGLPIGWQVADEDQQTPQTQVMQFTEAWIPFTSSVDTCVASTSYYVDSTSQSEDFLITPAISLLTFGNLVSWDAKSFDANYPESYIVLVSTSDASPSSFTDTVKIVNNVPPYWTTRTINLVDHGYANQNVYIAFKNVSSNAFILGIDNVRVTADDPAGISSDELPKVEIYPNPVKDVLKIKATGFKAYAIYNITGQIIQTGQTQEVNVSDLKTGHYFIKVETAQGVVTQRFVK